MSFSNQRPLLVFHLSLTDCKLRKISRTFLSILTDLSNAVLTLHLICNSSILLFGTVPSAQLQLGSPSPSWFTFFCSLAMFRYYFIFLFSFMFDGVYFRCSQVLVIFFSNYYYYHLIFNCTFCFLESFIQYLGWGKVGIIIILYSIHPFTCYFFNQIDRILLRRWAFAQSAFFFVFHKVWNNQIFR